MDRPSLPPFVAGASGTNHSRAPQTNQRNTVPIPCSASGRSRCIQTQSNCQGASQQASPRLIAGRSIFRGSSEVLKGAATLLCFQVSRLIQAWWSPQASKAVKAHTAQRHMLAHALVSCLALRHHFQGVVRKTWAGRISCVHRVLRFLSPPIYFQFTSFLLETVIRMHDYTWCKQFALSLENRCTRPDFRALHRLSREPRRLPSGFAPALVSK